MAPRKTERKNVQQTTVTRVAQLSFWLTYWEYECCGPCRAVGDEVSVDLSSREGELWEFRHGSGEDLGPTEAVRGRIEAIYWHPLEYERVGEREWRVVGRGSAVPIDHTEHSPTRVEQRRAAEERAQLDQFRRSRLGRAGRKRGVPGRWLGLPADISVPPAYGYDLEFVITY